MPEYSMTTAADNRDAAWFMVMAVPAPETFGAYQISVVEAAAVVLVPCPALVHVAPACVIEEIRLAAMPRVLITEIGRASCRERV